MRPASEVVYNDRLLCGGRHRLQLPIRPTVPSANRDSSTKKPHNDDVAKCIFVQQRSNVTSA